MAEWSGIGAEEPLNTQAGEMMIPIVAAMSRVENGRPAVLSDVEAGWTLYLQHKP